MSGKRGKNDAADAAAICTVSQWLGQLKERVGWHKAVVALAHKNARILGAVLTRGAVFDPNHVGEPLAPRCVWPRPAMP